MMTLGEAIDRIQEIRDKAADQVETEKDAEALNIAIDTHDLDETPKEREITFGELLDLIDNSREGDDAIELMGHNGEVDIAGRVSSVYFASLEDHVVNGFGAHNSAVQVWLED